MKYITMIAQMMPVTLDARMRSRNEDLVDVETARDMRRANRKTSR